MASWELVSSLVVGRSGFLFLLYKVDGSGVDGGVWAGQWTVGDGHGLTSLLLVQGWEGLRLPMNTWCERNLMDIKELSN